MISVERSAEVAVSPSEVWSVLSDFAAISSWASNVDHSCLLTDQSQGVGTVRRIQSGRMTLRETVETWETNVALSYQIIGLPAVMRSLQNTWLLAPSGDGTKVTVTTEIDTGPRPPQRLIGKAVGRRFALASEQMLDGLKAAAEGAHDD